MADFTEDRLRIADFKVFTYKELSQEAKEKVKCWILDDDLRNDIFYDDILCYLVENFPNSDLKVQYSLGYCQGDGLNVYGKLSLRDALNKIEGYSEKEQKTLLWMISNSTDYYEFTKNDRYTYSCKFMDEKYLDDDLEYIKYELKEIQGFTNLKMDLMHRFLKDVIDYFDDLDYKLKEQGYDYLYNITDEEADEECEANDWRFFEDGSFTKLVCAMDFK